MKSKIISITLLFIASAGGSAAELTVFAAASLTDAMKALAGGNLINSARRTVLREMDGNGRC